MLTYTNASISNTESLHEVRAPAIPSCCGNQLPVIFGIWSLTCAAGAGFDIHESHYQTSAVQNEEYDCRKTG